jgi:hypothetical protein
MEPVAQERERGVDRHPVHALRHGETVVAEARRGQRRAHSPTSRRMKAAMPVTSSRSKSGRSVSGRASLAMARIVGFSGREEVAARRLPGAFRSSDAARTCSLRQDQVAGVEPGEERLQRRLLRAPQFRHQRPAERRGDEDLPRPGLAVAVAVAAGMVDLGRVVGVLDGRDAEPLPRQFRHEPLGQRGLAGVLPAGDAPDPHARPPSGARRSRCPRAC